MFILLINLTLEVKEPKIVFEWLVEKNVITGSQSDKRIIQRIIHHWKESDGEIFQKYTKFSSKNEEINVICDQSQIDQTILSVHEGKQPVDSESPKNKF